MRKPVHTATITPIRRVVNTDPPDPPDNNGPAIPKRALPQTAEAMANRAMWGSSLGSIRRTLSMGWEDAFAIVMQGIRERERVKRAAA